MILLSALLCCVVIGISIGLVRTKTNMKVPNDYKDIAKQNSGFAVSHGMVWKENYDGVIGDKTLVKESFK